MNKQLSAGDVVAGLENGMTLGIGGWGPRRKPMALIREILRSDLEDLTVIAYGGPEVGMLAAAGKLRRVVFGFVSLDSIPLEPHFRAARQAGRLEVRELDEGMVQWGLRAAAMRVPFLPTPVGFGTDILTHYPELRTVRSPYEDGEELVAMPALCPDVSLIHVDEADRLGNTRILGPDPYFDDLFARAAGRCYVSCERLSDQLAFPRREDARLNYFERNLVTGVVEAPGGAHPTSCAPEYGWDMDHLKRYAASARGEAGWQGYADEFLGGSEADYLDRVGGLNHVTGLPLPVF